LDRVAELNRIVEEHNLSNHPFYQDWVKGTLPVEKLQAYAADYGHFIGTIAEGWEQLGMQELADEERHHEVLWTDFRNAIEAGSDLKRSEAIALVHAARTAFSDKPSSIGGLYAFEAQQPVTAASKLHGLNEHYNVSEAGKEYFVVHADDVREVEILAEAVQELNEAEFEVAKAQCKSVCVAMWKALDGLYE
jgi:pyrroloquinoline-quinone synthase